MYERKAFRAQIHRKALKSQTHRLNDRANYDIRLHSDIYPVR